MTEHVRVDADGTAALGICESLLIMLTEGKIIAEQDARDLLTDVVTSHQEASVTSRTPEMHLPSSRSCSASLRERTACAARQKLHGPNPG